MTRYIELSHTINQGDVTYPGLPGLEITDYLSYADSWQYYAEGTTFQISKITMVANTGTYLDTPAHRYQGRTDIAGKALETVAGLEGLCIRCLTKNGQAIEPEVFSGYDLQDKAVLLNTGWSEYWGTEAYFTNHPFLTMESAELLVDSGVILVGIDSLNIDDKNDPVRPAHTHLLGSDIGIVEHMTNLEALPDNGFRFFAVPPKIQGVGSFPVRAFAMVEE